MAPPNLKLIEAAPPDPGGERPIATPWIGIVLLAFAPVASLLGAGRAREPIDARAIAGEAIQAAIDRGAEAPEVRRAALGLREEVTRRPLGAATRAVYASLLLELAAKPIEREAAAFHASRAAALAPVTVPVVETSARVLARAGKPEAALDLARSMFDYDPRGAARLTTALESLLGPEEAREAIPDTPAASAAWIDRLRAVGRNAEAAEALENAWRRWPRDPWVRRQAAGQALARSDWKALAEIVPPREAFPGDPDSAPLYAFRSRLRAATGDPEGARRDADEACRLRGGDAWVRLQAGIAMEDAGDRASARAHFETGLFSLPSTSGTRWLRVQLLTRLARLAEREGRAGDALRAWRQIAEIEPGNEEAGKRLPALKIQGLRE